MKLSNCILTHTDFWNVKHLVAVSFRFVGERWVLFLALYASLEDTLGRNRWNIASDGDNFTLTKKDKNKLIFKSWKDNLCFRNLRGQCSYQVDQEVEGSWTKNYILIPLFFLPFCFFTEKTVIKTKSFYTFTICCTAVRTISCFPDSHYRI